jgi:hypothetical protein
MILPPDVWLLRCTVHHTQRPYRQQNYPLVSLPPHSITASTHACAVLFMTGMLHDTWHHTSPLPLAALNSMQTALHKAAHFTTAPDHRKCMLHSRHRTSTLPTAVTCMQAASNRSHCTSQLPLTTVNVCFTADTALQHCRTLQLEADCFTEATSPLPLPTVICTQTLPVPDSTSAYEATTFASAAQTQDAYAACQHSLPLTVLEYMQPRHTVLPMQV